MNLPWAAVAGGAMIGAAAVLLLATTGRVAGVSGIAMRQPACGTGGTRLALGVPARPGGRRRSRAVVAGTAREAPRALLRDALPAWQLVGAGVLVGVGTRLGNGCTSGHGVCGMARGSKRSVLAVLVFMACAMLTTFLIRHGGGLR